MDQALESLNRIEKLELASPEGISRVRTNLSELRSYANNQFASKIAQKEQEDENNFYRIRRNREQAEEGPNEIYLELKSREELRREQGLPPRAVILPWTQADDDRVLAMHYADRTRWACSGERSTGQRRKSIGLRRSAASASFFRFTQSYYSCFRPSTHDAIRTLKSGCWSIPTPGSPIPAPACTSGCSPSVGEQKY